jgi:KaiC/GvpD/RAD55 family RecA-like ATPase
MFAKATREKIALKLAVTGPSGSGKTMSALRLASGLGKKIAVIDTENGSASLYADSVEFDVAVLEAPYTVKKYVEAIKAAQAAGYEVVVIDSLSHEWAGEGGLLDQKTAKEMAGQNGFTAWGQLGQQHEILKTAILKSPLHIVCTMRSKQDYDMKKDANNKVVVTKLGMAPIQREGMEYEFTTVWDVDMAHRATTTKDRTGLFTDEIAQITEEHGTRLLDWLKTAKTPVETAPVPTAKQMASANLKAVVAAAGYTGPFKAICAALLPLCPLEQWTAGTFLNAANVTEEEMQSAIASLKPKETPAASAEQITPRPIRYESDTSAVVAGAGNASSLYVAPADDEDDDREASEPLKLVTSALARPAASAGASSTVAAIVG